MRKLHAGVILLREWGGTRHQVTVLANGVFKWKATIFSVYLCNLLRQNRVSSDYFFDEFEAWLALLVCVTLARPAGPRC